MAVGGPGAEVDLRHELGPHEAHLARLLGAEPLGERARGDPHRLEPLDRARGALRTR